MNKILTITFRINLCFFALSSWSQYYQTSTFDKDQGLPQHEVTSIVQDKSGYLWIGTNGGGIAQFNGLNFISFSNVDDGLDNYLSHMQIDKDTLWITSRRGLIAQHRTDRLFYESIPLNKVCKVDENILVASQKGIRKLENLVLKFIEIHPDIDNSIINDLIYDGNWYWAASDKGTFKFKWQQQKLIVHQVATEASLQVLLANKYILVRGRSNITIYSKLKLEPIFSRSFQNLQTVFYDVESNSFLAVQRNSILHLNADLTVKHTSKLQVDKTVKINEVFKDKNKQLWLATSQGLLKLHSNSFVQYLSDQIITAVQPFDNQVYVATSSGGLILKDSLDDLVRIQNFNLNTYAFSKKDSLLFAGTDEGVYVLYDNKVIDTISKLPDVQQLGVNMNQLWVGSTTAGIAHFELDSLGIHFKAQLTEKDGLYDLSIVDMQFDSYGRLWYITSKNFLGYIENDVVHHLGQPLSTVVSLSTLTISNAHIYLGTQGDGIWVSSISSIKFNKLGGSSIKWKNIYQLYANSTNKLWVGTQNGVVFSTLSAPTIVETNKYFGRSDGFIGIETMQNAIAPSKNGMLFGTIDGLMEYLPNNEQRIEEIPKLTINRVKVDHQEVTLDSTQTIKVLPNQNSLEISFQSISINNPTNISYSYQLNDAPWSDWSDQQSVIIPSLAAQEYILQIKSKIANQESEIVVLKIDKKPYAYQTFWFQFIAITILLVVIVIGLVVYFKRRQKRLKTEHAQLELNNKLLKLEQQALQLQMNPHFIFNVLNDIKASAQSDYKVMQQTIFDFAGLLRGVLEHSRQSEITLQQELDILGFYLKLETHLSEKPFEYNFDIDHNIDPEETLIAPMLFQPFIENSIQHGISKLSSKGIIDVKIELLNKKLTCTIKDNGIGYIRSQKFKKANGHKSIAINVTRERIKTNYAHHRFEMEELKSETGDIVGTKVSFNMPYKTNF